LLAIKELQRLQKESKIVSLIPVNVSRLNNLEEREWYDPGNEKTIRFEFWHKMHNCQVSRQQS
jgi:hypothetical protein